VRELADQVVACDVSPAMVRAAERHPRTHYVVAGAERIPLRDATAGLATVAAAFHWIDQPRVFAEFARVLGDGAGLAVYSDFFHRVLVDRPAFTDWIVGSYLPRYPTPARHAYFDSAAAAAAGFDSVTHQEDEILVPLTRTQLADYLVSQSNAVVAIESGAVTARGLHRTIVDETGPFFPDDRPADFVFGIRVWTTVRRR
jgi:SAM-dependent methyltransferase